MAEDIVPWLEKLGLGKYAEAFAENEISFDALPHLSEADLKELGLPMGPRKIAAAAIAGLGARLGDAAPAPPPTPPAAEPTPPQTGAAERRQLTVMFCDMVGSTELAGRLDPEDLRELMRRYQDAVSGAVARFGGHVAKFLGDGVLAYFGWPQAYEDQAERAVRSGLDAIAAVRALQLDGGDPMAARVGIATGQVVVGDLVGEGSRDAEAVTGETPNLAARLQGIAETGRVVIGAATRDLIGNAFALEDLGEVALKGFAAPVAAWRVAGEQAVESRFEAAHGQSLGRSLGRFVGREHELGLLLDRWELVKDGEGQAVLISGEPGIGKSRLMQALRDKAADEPHVPLHYQCSPFHSNSTLYPITQRLEQAAGFAPGDSRDERFDKLEVMLQRTRDDVATSLPLIANLLSLPFEDRYGALSLTPQQIKQRTLEVLVGQLRYLSQERPALFLFEDAHWIDPTSQELLDLSIGSLGRHRVLFVITHRPEWQAPFAGHAHVTSLQLNRLGRRQGAEIVNTIAGRQVPDDIVDRIAERADGIPLFIEELTRSLVEGGLDTAAGSSDIPETLQGSLMARLDRLSAAAKDLAQVGSVIGREFDLPLLGRITGRTAGDLEAPLQELLDAQLVLKAAWSTEGTITFRHAMIRDVAYQSQLFSRRREIHGRIAEALERDFADVAAVQPELVARHYSEAGQAETAIDYWRRAGNRSAQSLANNEAVEHFNNALAQLESLPAAAERDRMELDILLAMGTPLVAATGYASDAVERAFRRAEHLCVELGDADNLFAVRRGLWNFYLDRPDFARSQALAETLVETTVDAGNPEEHALARRALCSSLFYLGEFAAAKREAAAGIEAAAARDGKADFARYGEDAGATCRQYLGWAELCLGRPDTAVAHQRSAVEKARELGNPLGIAFANVTLEINLRLRREPATVLETAEANLALCEEHGLVFWRASSQIAKGWVAGLAGDVDDGLALMRQGFDNWCATGARIHAPQWLSVIAEVCEAQGRVEEGLETIRRALTEADRTQEAWSRADSHRLHGLLLVQAGDEAAGTAELDKAIELARRQGGKWFELRASRDRAKLMIDAGQRQQAADLLSGICAEITEREVPDIQEALSLLQSVSES